MKKYTDKLFCFSPPVMVATFIIEITLALYAVAKYKMTGTTRIIIALLVLLGVFQLAEFNVCGGLGVSASYWSRLGYAAISMLPALAFHLIYSISGKKINATVWISYAIAFAWAVTFGFSELAFSGHVCEGNYVIFQLSELYAGPYFAYYYAVLFGGIAMALYNIDKTSKSSVRRALLWQIAGYLSFILPTAVVNTINPATISGLPSIMCGFAIIYALILVFGILPSVAKSRTVK